MLGDTRTPDVSILVPIFNVENYLAQCIESLVAQTYENIEIVLVDDGSTDNCPAIIEQYASRDDRIRVISKSNSGYGDSLNCALAEARGTWIGIVEPDDWADPTMCEHLLGEARRFEGADTPLDIVKGSYWRVICRADGTTSEVPSPHGDLVKPLAQPFTAGQCPELLCLHPSIWSALYRRSYLDEFDIRFEPIPGAGWADNPFFLETMVTARAIAFLNEPLYHYREFEDGTISHLKDWRVITGRWFDMCEVLKRRAVTDPGILEGHYQRGCAYLEMLHADFDGNDPELRAEIDRMAATIDYDVVKKSRLILKNYKRAYARSLSPVQQAGLLSGLVRNRLTPPPAPRAAVSEPLSQGAPEACRRIPGSDNPLVSVIVPIFNVERFLDQALESIESQTLENIEIICVNDGSTDSSPSIVEAHADRDGRIRIIDKPNGGYGSACNRGIAEARGTWLAIVEPDDWIEPDMYADMTAYADSFGKPVDIVKTPYWRIVNPDTPAQQRLNCSYRKRVRPRTQPFDFHDEGVEHLMMHHPSIWSALYRADFIRDAGIRFPELPGAGWADNPFLAETMCKANRIVYLDKPYYCYREETPEQADASVKKNPQIPLERWHDIQDILDSLDNPPIGALKSQVRRGFTYLDFVSTAISLNDPWMMRETARIFMRLNDSLVLSDTTLSPLWKQRYCQIKGLKGQSISTLPYWASLASAGVYSIANIGPKAALSLTGDVLKRDRDEASTIGSGAGKPDKPKDAETARANAADEVDALPSATLSVIVPVYNCKDYLPSCLDSLDKQTYGNFEVLFVDDGSTDSSRSILDDYVQQHPNARVLSKPNGGPSSARNVGIEHATGEFVCFLDADDLFEPDTCLRIAQSVADDLDIVGFGWSCMPADQANRWLTERTNVRDAYYPSFTESLMFDEMVQPYLRSAIRRSLLEEQNIRFDEDLRVGEDAQFLFAAYPRAKGAMLISDKLYRYRLPHEGSIMSPVEDDVVEKSMRDITMMISIFADWDEGGFLDEHGARLVEWYVQFLLYTILRMPAETRRLFVSLTKDLWLAHFRPGALRTIGLPAHAAQLVDIVLDSDDEGNLAVSEGSLSTALSRYRIAEYGPADLVLTVFERLRG